MRHIVLISLVAALLHLAPQVIADSEPVYEEVNTPPITCSELRGMVGDTTTPGYEEVFSPPIPWKPCLDLCEETDVFRKRPRYSPYNRPWSLPEDAPLILNYEAIRHWAQMDDLFNKLDILVSKGIAKAYSSSEGMPEECQILPKLFMRAALSVADYTKAWSTPYRKNVCDNSLIRDSRWLDSLAGLAFRAVGDSTVSYPIKLSYALEHQGYWTAFDSLISQQPEPVAELLLRQKKVWRNAVSSTDLFIVELHHISLKEASL